MVEASTAPDTTARSAWLGLLGQAFVERACPVCAAERETRALFIGDRHNMGLRNVICRVCGHIYVNPAPEEAWLDRFYTQVYRQLYNAAAEPNDEYLQVHDPVTLGIRACMEWLHKRAPFTTGQTVLDIGCAEGAYLHEVKRLGEVNLMGFEPSSAFAAFARRRLPGASIATKMFSASALQGQRVDTVIAAHVLEHILEPAAFLTEIRDVLTPNGRLYLEVPVGDRKHVKNIFHIAHLNHFTQSSLVWVMHRSGFRVLHVDQQGTRGGGGGAYRLLAQPAEDGSALKTDTLIPVAQEVVRHQRRNFLRYRLKKLPYRIGKRLVGRRPESML